MAHIKNEVAYQAALKRIDELLPLVKDTTPKDDKNYLELEMISDMVEEYEAVHYPIGSPTLAEIVKLRMYEQEITTERLSEMLGLTQATLTDFLDNRYIPTLTTGRLISQKLNIDPAIVLGI